jgi:protein SCO1/2
MSKKQRLLTFVFILLSFMLWASLLLLPGVLAKVSQQQGYGLVVDRAMPLMQLYDVSGEAVTQERFDGRFVYFYIGYLNCNGVCQSHLSTLFQLDRNADEAMPFDIVFMTMDPERDTPAVLERRINSLGSRFNAVMPVDFAAGQAIARQFNVPFAKQPSRTQDYEIEHAAFMFLIDPNGRWIRTYTGRFLNAEQMLNELHFLSKGYNNEPT